MIVSGTHNIEAQEYWRWEQLQEVYIDCDTTNAPVTLNFFQISDLQEFFDVKFYITDIGNNASINPITINCNSSDNINYIGTTSIVLNVNGARAQMFVTAKNKWAFINASPIIYSAYDTIQDEGLNLPKRTVIDFKGSGVTATDVVGKTIVTIPGVGGTSDFGSFYDTTTQTGNSGSVLTMSLNTSDSWNSNISVVAGTKITLATPAVYNLAFSAQMVKNAGNSATHAHIWLAQNGNAIPYSASQISFPSNSVYIVAAWNFFFKTTLSNEYVELKWEINSNVNNAIAIQNQIASGNIPEVPSLIVTVNKIN